MQNDLFLDATSICYRFIFFDLTVFVTRYCSSYHIVTYELIQIQKKTEWDWTLVSNELLKAYLPQSLKPLMQTEMQSSTTTGETPTCKKNIILFPHPRAYLQQPSHNWRFR